jgi:3-oxoacyl-[acyl-carrier protein] reductase
MNPRPLSDKIVVVTGGSRGIGRGIVRASVKAGAKVVFCARSLGPESTAVVREAEELGGPGCATAVAADVSREPDVEKLFDVAVDRYDHVDVLVNNAGINRDDLLVRMPVDVFDEVMATNLTGAFLASRRAVQEFLGQGDGGRIVSITSMSQYGGRSQSAYAASKGGLLGLTRSIAKEYGHKRIFANLVAGGYVETDLSSKLPEVARKYLVDVSPLRRSGSPDEIASVVVFMCSADASFINGEIVHATGGLWDVPQ